ncbi:Protein K11D9.3 [Aphelenchoides avenae]|nr:Protein K11D9.3 [Aphelenchus avenae]
MLFDVNRFHAIALFTWQFSSFFATQNIFPIFLNYVPAWRCPNSTLFGRDCKVLESCRETAEFDHYFHSAAWEFDWICGPRSYLPSLLSQLQFVGVLLGAVTFGRLSDSFGRKPTALFALFSGVAICAVSGKQLTAIGSIWSWGGSSDVDPVSLLDTTGGWVTLRASDAAIGDYLYKQV